MLHAMGTQHEQSRSDRMKMTSMLWKNIDTKNLNNFDMANTKNAEPYDYKSIMQYELQVNFNVLWNMKLTKKTGG